jgi:hypothetical protein
MTTLEEIEKAIQELPKDEKRKLIDWVEELKEDLWDQQMEEDAKAGLLDEIAEAARKEPVAAVFRNGRWVER